MPYVIGAFRVKDFATWKQGFDEGVEMRKAGGVKSHQIFQTLGDPNKVVVLMEWDDEQKVEEFLQSPELQEAKRRSGVVEVFETYDTSSFLERVEAAPS